MALTATAVGSLFLRTQDGKLVERWWDANSRKKRWMWINHGHPPGAKIVSAPGALINGLSIFMTGTSGNLHERFWNSKEWVRVPVFCFCSCFWSCICERICTGLLRVRQSAMSLVRVSVGGLCSPI